MNKSRTPKEKWEEVKRLRQMAFNLKMAALKKKHPAWSDEQLKNAVKEIFLYAST